MPEILVAILPKLPVLWLMIFHIPGKREKNGSKIRWVQWSANVLAA